MDLPIEYVPSTNSNSEHVWPPRTKPHPFNRTIYRYDQPTYQEELAWKRKVKVHHKHDKLARKQRKLNRKRR